MRAWWAKRPAYWTKPTATGEIGIYKRWLVFGGRLIAVVNTRQDAYAKVRELTEAVRHRRDDELKFNKWGHMFDE